MKWKIICFWLFVFAGLWFFFFNSFGTSTFQRQEEVQLFISEWVVIRGYIICSWWFLYASWTEFGSILYLSPVCVVG